MAPPPLQCVAPAVDPCTRRLAALARGTCSTLGLAAGRGRGARDAGRRALACPHGERATGAARAARKRGRPVASMPIGLACHYLGSVGVFPEHARILGWIPGRLELPGSGLMDKSSNRDASDSIPVFSRHFSLRTQMNKSLLLASLVAAVALTACGKKEEAPAPAPAAMPAPVAAAASEAASAVAGAATAAADAAASAVAGAASGAADAAAAAATKAADAVASAVKK